MTDGILEQCTYRVGRYLLNNTLATSGLTVWQPSIYMDTARVNRGRQTLGRLDPINPTITQINVLGPKISGIEMD